MKNEIAKAARPKKKCFLFFGFGWINDAGAVCGKGTKAGVAIGEGAGEEAKRGAGENVDAGVWTGGKVGAGGVTGDIIGGVKVGVGDGVPMIFETGVEIGAEDG